MIKCVAIPSTLFLSNRIGCATNRGNACGLALVTPGHLLTILSGVILTLIHCSSGHGQCCQLLFDGKSLNGWEGNCQVFRVESRAILAGWRDRQLENNEFLCTTRDYDDFELSLEARLVGEGQNAGVQFRSRRVPDHHEVVGYQCDIGTENGRSLWGSLYDESRRRTVLDHGEHSTLVKVVRPEHWNRLVICCTGPRIQIWVNGYQTVDFVETDPDIPETGVIGLQIHSGKPAVASYRNIRIRPLEPFNN